MEHYFSSYEEVPVGHLMIKQENEIDFPMQMASFNQQAFSFHGTQHANPNGFNLMNDAFDTNLPPSLGALDEEQVLSLSSPETELEEFLFPDLRNQPDPQPLERKIEPHALTIMRTRPDEVSDSLEVNLCHKPRGCKGVWQPVGNKDALRVTKGKGKWLKLEIKSPFQFKSSDLEVYLLDVSGMETVELFHTPDEGFVIESTIESVQMGNFVVDVELKLDRVCKKLQFWVSLRTPFGIVKGKSVEFGAHNNGKANKKERDASDDSQSPVGDYDSNSSSSPTDLKTVLAPPVVLPQEKKEPLKKRKRVNGTEFVPACEEDPEEGITSNLPGSLNVRGVVRAKAFLQFSDLRLKTDIQDLTDAVNLVSRLQGKSFKWKKGEQMEEEEGGKRVIGLIAQEVQKVVPNVVHEDENGILSVAYAELVPILIEALKAHVAESEKNKGEIFYQLDGLNNQLQGVKKILETNQMEKEEMRNFLAPQIIHHSPVIIQQMMIEEPTKDNEMKRTIFRIAVLLLFLVGIAGVILGSVYLGANLSANPQILAEVVEAINLKAMDQDGVPDPYCEVEIGAALFRTDTLYNTPNPLWDETFSSTFDKSVFSVVFQMYDQNSYSFADLRIGFAEVDVNDLDFDQRYEEWLPLSSNAGDNSTSGQLRVALYISGPSKPGYELAILIVGFVITVVSLFSGFYTWRGPNSRVKSN